MYVFIYLLFISRRGQLLSYYIIHHVNLVSDWLSYFYCEQDLFVWLFTAYFTKLSVPQTMRRWVTGWLRIS